MYYNTIRSNSIDATMRSKKPGESASRSVNPKEKLINMQKREKLKGLLITKFMKKYGIKNPERILEKEIAKFLEGEVLNDSDLKRLDEKIRKMLKDKEDNDQLRRNLTTVEDPIQDKKELVLPELNKAETMSVHSKHSRMSGASHLSKFNDKLKESQEDEDLDFLSVTSSRKPLKRFDFSNEGDEWNAICQHNKKLHEEEKALSKLKDREIKLRTKEDLDSQIQQKLRRLHEEQLKNREYDLIQYNHTIYLNDLERQKQMEMKTKVLREKDNRDKQLKDEKKRKRIDFVKERKYDKELVKHLLAEIDKDKNKMIQKKIEEKSALQKTLKDNELNKIKAMEQLKKEREDDVRAAEEYGKILEKQENERIEYFKKIERSSNNFMSKMVDTVLKDMNEKNNEEEEKMRQYLAEKEIRDIEEDERKKYQIHHNKQLMKNFLDMQVDEKKKRTEFEKTMDLQQANVWKTDTIRYSDQEKDINERIRYSHLLNNDYLKTQISHKKSKKPVMTQEEYALNRNILEAIKSNS